MKTELLIPENLNELTLKQYREFIAIKEPDNIDALSIFLRIDKANINRIKGADVEVLIGKLNTLLSKEPVFIDRFKMGGVTYGFIPKLDDITYGENKDLTTYLNWDNMHKAMAVMYRPVTQSLKGKYLIEDYEGSGKYSEVMKHAPLGVVFGAMVFFWSLTNELLKAIPNYLEMEIQREQMQGVISVENGGAIQKSIHLLKEMLEDLPKLQGYDYTSV